MRVGEVAPQTDRQQRCGFFIARDPCGLFHLEVCKQSQQTPCLTFTPSMDNFVQWLDIAKDLAVIIGLALKLFPPRRQRKSKSKRR